jgi:hypothetical protein
MFSRLLKLPDDVRRRYDLASLEIAIHAAAPCPIQVKEQMIDWWWPIIHEYHGSTEGSGSRPATVPSGWRTRVRSGGTCSVSCTSSMTTRTLPVGNKLQRAAASFAFV